MPAGDVRRQLAAPGVGQRHDVPHLRLRLAGQGRAAHLRLLDQHVQTLAETRVRPHPPRRLGVQRQRRQRIQVRHARRPQRPRRARVHAQQFDVPPPRRFRQAIDVQRAVITLGIQLVGNVGNVPPQESAKGPPSASNWAASASSIVRSSGGRDSMSCTALVSASIRATTHSMAPGQPPSTDDERVIAPPADKLPVQCQLHPLVCLVLAACLALHQPQDRAAIAPEQQREVNAPDNGEHAQFPSDFHLARKGLLSRAEPAMRAGKCLPRRRLRVWPVAEVPEARPRQPPLPLPFPRPPRLFQHRVHRAGQRVEERQRFGQPPVVVVKFEAPLAGMVSDILADLCDTD